MSAPARSFAPRSQPLRRARGRWAAAALVAVAVVGATAGAVRAAAFGEADGAGDYTLPAGQTIDDNLFAAGNTVTIAGTVRGDLFAAGREVIVSGAVTGNVYAAGSRVTLGAEGSVDGDLFAGAAEIVVAGRLGGDLRGGGSVLRVTTGSVGGELMAGGFHIAVEKGGSVERGIYVGANQAAIDGRVGGDAEVGAAAIHLGGTVEGDATLSVAPAGGGGPSPALFRMLPNQVDIEVPATLAAGVDIDPAADVAGDLTIRAPSEPAVPDGVVGGTQDYEAMTAPAATTDDEAPAPEPPAARWTALALTWLRRTLALVVLGLIALKVLPGVMRTGVDRLTSAPVASGLWGALALVAAPLGLVVLAGGMIVVSLLLGYLLLGHLIGPWLATSTVGVVALTCGLYLVVWLGFACIAVALGSRFGGRLRELPMGALLAGAPIVALAMVLPVVGGPVKWVLAALGVGALVVPWLARWRSSVAPGAGGALPAA